MGFQPIRSVRINSLTEHSISRSKTPVDDPMSLLYNMNDCYSKLKELVQSIPQNKKVSKMEILQHVIDYILDLQIALDSQPTIVSLHHSWLGPNSSSTRTPLTLLNTDISILSLQASELLLEFITNDRNLDTWALQLQRYSLLFFAKSEESDTNINENENEEGAPSTSNMETRQGRNKRNNFLEEDASSTGNPPGEEAGASPKTKQVKNKDKQKSDAKCWKP
ncbi:DNA-binding protein inhibitor ID-2-like [Bombina bombina]|uniref:DNA-binding protein inhibitor ID-2-like n=1 Tax=Bombina bombina TaxID=8345 RepID=UPI00235A8C85|nr:DNA-binding protein inhibitor ID-2-like [Bombina bombina]